MASILRLARARGLDAVVLTVLAFALAAGVGSLVVGERGAAAVRQSPAAVAATGTFALCGRRAAASCVVDGDTFHLDGQIIRIADIDTPEVHAYGCAAEKALGDRATQRLRTLLNAGPFTLAPIDRDRDVYGRELRIVTRAGQSVGAVLVAEGLARSWNGARHPWC